MIDLTHDKGDWPTVVLLEGKELCRTDADGQFHKGEYLIELERQLDEMADALQGLIVATRGYAVSPRAVVNACNVLKEYTDGDD